MGRISRPRPSCPCSLGRSRQRLCARGTGHLLCALTLTLSLSRPLTLAVTALAIAKARKGGERIGSQVLVIHLSIGAAEVATNRTLPVPVSLGRTDGRATPAENQPRVARDPSQRTGQNCRRPRPLRIGSRFPRRSGGAPRTLHPLTARRALGAGTATPCVRNASCPCNVRRPAPLGGRTRLHPARGPAHPDVDTRHAETGRLKHLSPTASAPSAEINLGSRAIYLPYGFHRIAIRIPYRFSRR